MSTTFVSTSSLTQQAYGGMAYCRYDKILMIDRRFYGSEAVNPTYIVAGEYDIQTNAVRNVTGTPFSICKVPYHSPLTPAPGC